MSNIVRLCSRLKYIGLIGLPIFISDAIIFKLLWLFWLFTLVEVFYDRAIYWQSIKQLVGIPYVYITHHFKLPDPVNTSLTMQYILPFKEDWVAVNGGMEKSLSHSWGIVTQRYAYDFLMLDDKGNSFEGEKTQLHSYYCYEKEIIAPADGVVVEIGDKRRESKIFGNGQVDIGVKDIRGNYIIIKHGTKEYSLLGHLIPGSIKVQEGDRVKAGQELARCGNSGNSSEPHLHFQLQDGKSFFFSAGLPITFNHIENIPCEAYEKYDSRQTVQKSQLYKSGNIRRGQRVKNKKV